MMIMAMAKRRVRVRNRSRICACTVTSRPVVGSSAMSRRGRFISAMAISTRCAMPPESSCGQARARRVGSGMPTACIISRARWREAASLPPAWAWWMRTSWSPMRVSGSSEVRGFCTTMAMRAPRRAFSASAGRAVSSWPSKWTRPPTIRAGGRSRPQMDCAVSDLAAPVSPTMPSTRPASREKLTSFTASATRMRLSMSRETKWVRRFSTRSRLIGPPSASGRAGPAARRRTGSGRRRGRSARCPETGPPTIVRSP